MFVCGADPEAMEQLKARISSCLKELNETDKAPYELSVSMGYSKVKSRQPLKEVIEEADKNLYEDKERFRSEEAKITQ